MSVWVAHVPEERLPSHDITRHGGEGKVHLPLDEWPDVTGVNSPGELRQRLKSLHPESAPEAIAGMTERLWACAHAVHAEDIIAFPVPSMGEVCFAQALSRVKYEDGRYMLPVKWFANRARIAQFRHNRDIFENHGVILREVTSPQMKIAIRDRLPLPGNRFRSWKWLVGLLVLLQIMRVASRLLHHQGTGF